jgi:hypothetical protein
MGAITSFFAASSGAFQNDLKRVIAYSTCSQLGYMVFACGISSYSVTMFHLMNHAFFKALLFLSAGSIIHAMHDEQDMRRMGALNRLLPFTYTMTLIGSFALIGFPFLTGYYSKDVRGQRTIHRVPVGHMHFPIYACYDKVRPRGKPNAEHSILVNRAIAHKPDKGYSPRSSFHGSKLQLPGLNIHYPTAPRIGRKHHWNGFPGTL